MKTWTAKKIEDANNESASVGINELNGRFTAMTFSQSKTFKTFPGAQKWLAQRGYSVPATPDSN